jgi:hypothetical protein
MAILRCEASHRVIQDILVAFEQKGKAVSIGDPSKVTAEVKLIPATE